MPDERDEPFVDPDATQALPSLPPQLDDVPDMDDEPLRWDPIARRFVAEPARPRRPTEERLPPRSVPAVDPDATAHVPHDPTEMLVRPAPSPTPPPARPPARPPLPTPRTKPTRPPRRRRTRAVRSRIVRIAVVALVVLVVVPLALGWWQFNKVERVEVADALSSGGPGTNYLIVGTDDREGIDPDAADAGAFLDGEFGGARTDTIIVLRTGGASGAQMLSVPRDLWVTNPVTGEPGRINSTYASGPSALIRSVQDLGIPVHHYVEINFVSFGSLVDALGGVTVDVAHPARDEMSGLLIEEAGPARLDGTQALAYVRSRSYTELVDGQWRTDPTGDIGRTERQRAFLASLFSELGGTRNPLTLRAAAGALGPGVRIDDALTYPGALRFAWQVRGLDTASVELPVVPRTTSGGAAVLELRQPDAAEVLAQFNR